MDGPGFCWGHLLLRDSPHPASMIVLIGLVPFVTHLHAFRACPNRPCPAGLGHGGFRHRGSSIEDWILVDFLPGAGLYLHHDAFILTGVAYLTTKPPLC